MTCDLHSAPGVALGQLLPLEQPAVYVIRPRSARFWTAELAGLQLRDGQVIWDNPDDPDEAIRAVYVVPHHGGIGLVVTDRNLYVVDAATLAASCPGGSGAAL